MTLACTKKNPWLALRIKIEYSIGGIKKKKYPQLKSYEPSWVAELPKYMGSQGNRSSVSREAKE